MCAHDRAAGILTELTIATGGGGKLNFPNDGDDVRSIRRYHGMPTRVAPVWHGPPGLIANRTSRDWPQSTLSAFKLRCGDTCGKNEMTHEQKRAGALNGR